MDADTTPILIGTGLFGLGLFIWGFCVYVAYKQAPERGRSAGNWAVLALFFGPIALMALFVMAPKPRQHSGTGSHSGESHSGGAHQTQADLYEVPNKKKHHD